MTAQAPPVPDVTGVILAGGESSRMGADKALLTVDGVSFLARIGETVAGVTGDVVISAGEEGRYAAIGPRVIADRFRGCGPLAGIHAALSSIPTSRALVVSCDLPLVTPEACRRLLGADVDGDVIIARSDSRLQPLLGVYHNTIIPPLERCLREGRYSVLDFLNEVCVTVLDFGAASWLVNVNTPGDYELIRARDGSYLTTAPSPLS